jgi:NMD protein affecting ribosome stability and mRNA decay
MSTRQQFTLVQPFITLHCVTCGIAFAVPQRWWDDRNEDHRTYCCPNRHAQHIPPAETPKPSLEQRQETILALHRAEQAEAKAADLAAGKPGVPAEPPPVVTLDGKRLKCADCGKTYAFASGMIGHLRQRHGIENAREQVEASIGSGAKVT